MTKSRLFVSALLLFGLAAPPLPAVAQDAGLVAEIKAAKAALDSAFEAHDVAAIEAMMTPDHIGVTSYYGRPLNAAEEIATLDQRAVSYSDFTDQTVTPLGPDAAMLTAENSLQGTFQGRPVPARVFTTEVWVKQDGKWRQQLFQETPIGP